MFRWFSINHFYPTLALQGNKVCTKETKGLRRFRLLRRFSINHFYPALAFQGNKVCTRKLRGLEGLGCWEGLVLITFIQLCALQGTKVCTKENKGKVFRLPDSCLFRRSGDRWIWVLKSKTLDNMVSTNVWFV